MNYKLAKNVIYKQIIGINTASNSQHQTFYVPIQSSGKGVQQLASKDLHYLFSIFRSPAVSYYLLLWLCSTWNISYIAPLLTLKLHYRLLIVPQEKSHCVGGCCFNVYFYLQMNQSWSSQMVLQVNPSLSYLLHPVVLGSPEPHHQSSHPDPMLGHAVKVLQHCVRNMPLCTYFPEICLIRVVL